MRVEAPVEVIDTSRSSDPVPRGWAAVGMTVAAPVAYAGLYNYSFRTDENPFALPDGLMLLALFALKLLTVAALIVGLHRIGARIETAPSVAAVAAGIWLLAGLTLVAVVAWLKGRGAFLGIDHLWPGRSDPELVSHLSPGPGPDWNPTRIVIAEMLAVVVLAFGVAAVFWLAGRRLEAGQRLARGLVTALAMIGFLSGLLIYDQIVGWPVLFDFDPFVGDAVLGTLTYELVVLPGPVDPLGAITLAVIAVANGLILAAARWAPAGRG